MGDFLFPFPKITSMALRYVFFYQFIFSEMVLFRQTNRIYPNRLACKNALGLSCSQYKKMIRSGALIPINKENMYFIPEKWAV